MAVLEEILWIVVVGAIGAFWYGWATGSNDVANAFGTSVGAKTLTLFQAVIIAAIFEFAGALLLGRVSISVISGGIANISLFQSAPEVYAYGMMVTLLVGSAWQTVASVYGYNVSATHTIIGGILGFSIVWGGAQGVNWATPDPSKFPPYSGVVPIVCAWFVAPVLGSIGSALIFFVVRTLVLRRRNAYFMSFWVLPFFAAITIFINIYFIFTRGLVKYLKTTGTTITNDEALMWSGVAAGGAFVIGILAIPLMKKGTERQRRKREEAEKAAADGTKIDMAVDEHDPTAGQRVWKALTHGVTVNVHEVVEEDPVIAAIHENAEKFDVDAENVFGYLQVFSAICVIFAHGAGEVGYMAGPIATIWTIYQTGNLSKDVQPEIWTILIGAVGLVIGLATYGYNVTRSMGVKLSKLTPSRGFAAELSTAMCILVASQYGLPVSSSQVITGSIVGVGLLEGVTKGINWRFFGVQFLSWVSTLVVIGLGVAGLFAQGVYAPSKPAISQLQTYEFTLMNSSAVTYKTMNSTLLYLNTTTDDQNQLSEYATLYQTVQQAAKQLSWYYPPPPKGTANQSVSATQVLGFYNTSLGLWQNLSIFTLSNASILGQCTEPTPECNPQLVFPLIYPAV